MEPLIVLVVVSAVLGLLGLAGVVPRRDALALRGGVAAMFVTTGVAHFDAFAKRDELVAMVPPQLPAPDLLVTVTGVLELVGAAGLLMPRVWPWAAAALSALLVAMFPANVYKALTDPTLSLSQQLGPRTIIQLLFLLATAGIVWQAVRTGWPLRVRREQANRTAAVSAPGDRRPPDTVHHAAPAPATRHGDGGSRQSSR